MFSLFSNFSLPSGIRLSREAISSPIRLESVQIHDVETKNEKRARTLKHLLKLNHANHSILFNHNRFHNHTPHVCIHSLTLAPTNAFTNLDLRICISIRIEPGATK